MLTDSGMAIEYRATVLQLYAAVKVSEKRGKG
jgi:hypothetical protein